MLKAKIERARTEAAPEYQTEQLMRAAVRAQRWALNQPPGKAPRHIQRGLEAYRLLPRGTKEALMQRHHEGSRLRKARA